VDIHQFGDWLAGTAFSQSIQTSSWAIPGIQTVHLIALALTFTAAVIVSLRFAGFGITSEPLAQLASRYTGFIWKLLLVLLISGSLLITAEPGRTITNPAFYLKMGMLVTVIVLTLWLAARARQGTAATPVQKIVAGLAVMLWIGIIFAGRLIAYVESN
jgi:hypothetical protein